MEKQQHIAKLCLLNLDQQDYLYPKKILQRDWIPNSSPQKNQKRKRVLQIQGSQKSSLNLQQKQRCLPCIGKSYKENLKRLLKTLEESSYNGSPNKRKSKNKKQKKRNTLYPSFDYENPEQPFVNKFIKFGNSTVPIQSLIKSKSGSLNRRYQRPLTHHNNNINQDYHNSQNKFLDVQLQFQLQQQNSSHCFRKTGFLYGNVKDQFQVQVKIKQKLFQKQSQKNMTNVYRLINSIQDQNKNIFKPSQNIKKQKSKKTCKNININKIKIRENIQIQSTKNKNKSKSSHKNALNFLLF